jgi:HEAT repeat protein
VASLDIGETVPPPTAVPDVASSSSTSSDLEAASQNSLEQDLTSPPYVSPSLEIPRSRLIRRRDEWTEAETAADALGRIGAPATAEIVAMLDDPDATVRRRGAEILARIGGDAEEAIPSLIRIVEHDPQPQVRKAAVYALGQMGPKASAAIPVLTRMLRNAPN